MRFRADIEGLRGAAIAMVLLAHADAPGFAGGFVGVDVFFVISGFLITSALFRELESGNAIDCWAFYARRARRLIPALMVMLVVVAALAAALLPPSVLPLQATTGLLAAMWVSNFYFALAGLDYFAPDASSSLYLHTWSLGVEEQFYLAWPALLVLVWRWKPARPRARLIATVASLAVGSFLIAIWLHRRDPVMAYYLMPTRLWELAIGGLVALVPGRLGLVGANRSRAAGLVLIMFGLIAARSGNSQLFVLLLLPVAGAALVLRAQRDESAPASGILGFSVLRFLGRVSYALYLWHWPLLALARARFEGQPLAIAAAVALALACACMSTVWLEEPIRKLRWANHKGHVLLGLTASLMLVVGHQWWRSAIQHDASTKRSAALAILREQVSGPPLYKLGCDRPFKSAELYPCQLVEPPRAARRVLLIGDSVAAQWTPALEVVSRRRDWHLTTLTKAGCPIVDVRIYYARIGREYFECEAWRNLVAGYINRERFDLVIVGSAATYDLTPQQWQLGTHSFLAKIHRAAGTIVLVTPTPVLPFDALDCLLTLDGLAADNLDRCSVARSDAEDIEVSSALKLAAESFSNVRQADFNPLVCPSNRCTVVRHGQLVYRDKVHLNVSFVTGLTDRFESALLSAADGQKAR